ncbi:uncharacterized protein V1513DRAFT_470243 [Lipomyces chichibuensis]|uniref:uncharacterized protein n=1 Tax=Lipomyces chichibuensis TaxID=1546026 RepID=UPI0033435022
MPDLKRTGSNQHRRRSRVTRLLATPVTFLASCLSSSHEPSRHEKWNDFSNDRSESYIFTTTVSTNPPASFSSTVLSPTPAPQANSTPTATLHTRRRKVENKELLIDHEYDHILNPALHSPPIVLDAYDLLGGSNWSPRLGRLSSMNGDKHISEGRLSRFMSESVADGRAPLLARSLRKPSRSSGATVPTDKSLGDIEEFAVWNDKNNDNGETDFEAASPREHPVSETTTVVVSRSTILSDITNTSNRNASPVLRVVNRRFSVQIPNADIKRVDVIVWYLLHRTDTFAFPPSIAAIQSAVVQRHPAIQNYFTRTDKQGTRDNMSDFIKLLTQRLFVQQERFLDDMYSKHAVTVGEQAGCSTDCFASHVYGEFFDFEQDCENDDDEEEAGNIRHRYLQYAALWRRVAEEIDFEGPHMAAEWWSLAELKFKVMKARLRHSRVDEMERYLQQVLDED